MAEFSKALNGVQIAEGGYVNDPDDPGGETYCGIARKYHPDWPGWKILDRIRDKDSAFTRKMLKPQVDDFYRREFWDRFQGDSIRVQAVADELMDCAVNIGVSDAVKFLQAALNSLNRRGTLYPNLVVDGGMGAKTLATVNWFSLAGRENDAAILVRMQNVLQGAYYIERMQENETKEKYARGWFSRVTI